MRFITISDELYDYLARLARPGENIHHVIARTLGFTGASFDDEAPILINGRPRGKWQRGWGSLKRFIEAGDFAPGDELRIAWPHRRQTLTVAVDRHGMLTDSDGTVYTSLAAAAEVVTGHKGSGPFSSPGFTCPAGTVSPGGRTDTTNAPRSNANSFGRTTRPTV